MNRNKIDRRAGNESGRSARLSSGRLVTIGRVLSAKFCALFRNGWGECIFSDICGTDAGVGCTPASSTGLGDYTAAGAFRHPARVSSRALLTGSVVENAFLPLPRARARAPKTIGSRTGGNTSGADVFRGLRARLSPRAVVYGSKRVLL